MKVNKVIKASKNKKK